MSKLLIKNLSYHIHTIDKELYGATVPFREGLNIIYGPNSVGKTSIITGIIYGLGAEKGLGIFKSIQNPFKPEFYQSIDGKVIEKSYLLLEISNGLKTITIFRYIKGGDINIVAVKESTVEFFHETKEVEKYIIAGEGVFSEKGFQNYLFNFLDLNQVELPTYDQKFSKLYFENVLPLFFVEQRAGWSQIQARQVLRYNIKDVKKVAFEYLMGLDRFNLHLLELQKKELEHQIKNIKDDLRNKEENLLVIANAENSAGVLIINTPFIGKSSISDYIIYLRERYSVELKEINTLSSQNKEFEVLNSRIKDDIIRMDSLFRKENERIEKITNEISGYETYLQRIRTNKYKNKQLKKIQEFSSSLNIKSCPICESKLKDVDTDECILCHSDLTKKISTPDQNLSFLEDEENTFKKVIAQRILDRKKLTEVRNQIRDKIKLRETQLDHQTKTFAGKDFAAVRQKILEIDSVQKEMEKYERIYIRWKDLLPTREKIDELNKSYETLKTQISEYVQTENDTKILDSIKSFIQSDVKELGLFKGNKDLINNIKLDATDNYTPYLDNFDIYNISSSSDNIRIILSYYLSLFQTSIKLKKNNIKYPNILIFDEPKQQNLDNDSLIDCIKVIEKIPPSAGQIILTTYSELPGDRDKLKKYIIYEMKNKRDYLLKKKK